MAANNMKHERFRSKSIADSLHGDRVIRILKAALDAADPAASVERNMQRIDTQLTIGNRIYDLTTIDRVLMIGFGKASMLMGETTMDILGDYLSGGVLITKGQVTFQRINIPILEGAHPVPDMRSLVATQKIVDLLSTTSENDLVVCLISGGGSALLTLPVPGITLEDIQSLTKTLLRCGATINQINCLRKHLSQVKGGHLARLAAPSQIATLILSDVIDNRLDVIASGPTVPDASTYSDAIQILERLEIIEDVPDSILNYLKKGDNREIPETPKTGDPIFEKVHNTIIGNNYQASKAAIKQAEIEGFNTLLLTTSLQGEASIAGKILAAIAKQIASTGEPVCRPACIVIGGETTVTLRGGGLGGRNQELALGSVEDLSGINDLMLITLATDGDDGPTDAAGAVVTGETFERANALGKNPVDYLAKNASYEFFELLDDLLKPGMTGTNVNDLTFLILF